jgi:hypothetical protein
MKYYNELKNHIHNTLGITKAQLREMVDKSVERVVERRMDVLFEEKFESQYNMQRIIDDSIKLKITKNNWFWGESEDTLDDYIKKEVVKALLKKVKLNVEITNKGTPALDIAEKPRVYSRKAKK